MNDFFIVMWKPILACLILTGIHAYLGIHVIEREVIFVDLALAQIAALGAVLSLFFGFRLHGAETYWFSLSATFLGAAIFSAGRMRRARVPQEAVIGIVYAVSAASAILVLSRLAEGDEEIRHMLVGNILLVDLPEIAKMSVLYSAVGFFHWYFRRTFVLISTDPEGAYRQGIRLRWWDLLFYLTFGLVVTSSVEVAGVLLVFTFLIVPAVAAVLFCRSLSARLTFGWAMGTVSSLLGILCSYSFDLPTGAAVVCAFAAVLLFLVFARRFFV